MEYPDWFILIDQWVEKYMGGTGVTLPFLVGALAYKAHDKDIDVQYVDNLLDKIIKKPVEGYVTQIQWCPDIKSPVFSTCQYDGNHCKNLIHGWFKKERILFKESFARPSGEGKSLVFSIDIQQKLGLDCKDATECREKLVANAMEPISRGTYSKQRSGEYTTFKPDELNYIHETIMSS